ncbi:hypothetical protein E4T49_04790 [Aureobasidium sp. EXF-10728]|nr:hypothetical protein E4T49_04790 [Aureobasidium sp. EXF-10728]
MSTASIIIIGAGIAGLSAARLLKQKNIPCIVFEQSSPDKSQGYAITLREWAFLPLLAGLGDVPLDAFVKAVAVDRELDGCGNIDLTFRDNGTGETLFNPDPLQPGQERTLFRANRSVLRDWLSQGLDIRYGHKLSTVQGKPGNVTAVFENGLECQGSMIIGADGVHSAVRNHILPETNPEVLPVILFHGQKTMPLSQWQHHSAQLNSTSTILAGVGDNFNTFLTIANATPDATVHLDWTYSRARQTPNDALWMPSRGDLTKVPHHLLKEIRSLDLTPPFSTLVNADSIKKGKVYNWQIRALQVARGDLDAAAALGVVFIGDAVHAMPIFGGEGGNHAILDTVELIGLISAKNGGGLSSADVEQVVHAFNDGAHQRGQDAVKRCTQRFTQFHQPMSKWKMVAKMANRKAGS